ncbi:hypothetical protein Ahy_B05g078928 isoform L [Arachis hypogaea]|uniref:Uncharacterized protein n=1 Tax=Arachis hypogaea TaxID=3818 RepID=A0A444Z8P9_ARAHY|nr:hypothetical protein Ahy_B05g078928 isoform L [Arachis hypogaea]
MAIFVDSGGFKMPLPHCIKNPNPDLTFITRSTRDDGHCERTVESLPLAISSVHNLLRRRLFTRLLLLRHLLQQQSPHGTSPPVTVSSGDVSSSINFLLKSFPMRQSRPLSYRVASFSSDGRLARLANNLVENHLALCDDTKLFPLCSKLISLCIVSLSSYSMLFATRKKLKIELAKVRDEFKMSESNHGSARVQVAQLTTKIKHLSVVLHKKIQVGILKRVLEEVEKVINEFKAMLLKLHFILDMTLGDFYTCLFSMQLDNTVRLLLDLEPESDLV